MSRFCLEILVRSSEEAIRVEAAGAHRVELCSALEVGGLTPSIGTVRQTVRSTRLPVVAMLRPRPGDFTYSDGEFEGMLEDASAFVEAGVAGLVTGHLTESGAIDAARMERILAIAGPIPVIFHRAFDRVPDLNAGLELLVGLGVRRILTSGGHTSAVSGAKTLASLRQQAGRRIEIMAGGGLRSHNLPQVFGTTGIYDLHLGPRCAPDAIDPALVTLFGAHDTLDLPEVERVVAWARTLESCPDPNS